MSVSLILIIIGLVAIVAYRLLQGNFAAWRARLPAGMPNTDFLRTPETYTILAVFVFLEFTLWLVDLARWHHLIYLFAVLLVSAVQQYVPTGRRFAAYGMMFAAFTILGLYPWLKCNEACQLKKQEVAQVEAQKAAAKEAAEAQRQAAVQAARLEALQPAKSAKCPGVGKTIRVGAEWTEVNPQFNCDITFEVGGGTADLGEPDNFVTVAPGSAVGNVLKEKGVQVVFAKVVSGKPVLNYWLCPKGTGTGGWACKRGEGLKDVRQAGITLGLGLNTTVGGYYK